MHLILFWAAAFATLCAALVLLNIYGGVIGNDLVLHGAGKEAVIAGVASLVEGAGVWLVVYVVPGAGRAMIIPFLIVGLIYKVAHFEDWSKIDVVMLLAFQLVVWFVAASLYGGHIKAAVVIVGLFGAILVLVASFAKDL
jgi:hypothetical protein